MSPPEVGNVRDDLTPVVGRFAIDGELVSAVSYGSGHINDTYAVTYEIAGVRRRYVHQRINQQVFRDPAGLMDNVARVTRHLREKVAASGVDDVDRHVLLLIPTRDGADYLIDEAGEYWRAYAFIEGAATYDVVETPAQAREVARAFGRFQQQLTDLGSPPLIETIPGFHDTPARLLALRRAVAADAVDRVAAAGEEIERFEAYAPLADAMSSLARNGRVPVRVAHNDTKINNVLIDEISGEGLCIIDLDTVMPGLALDDFGDLVRTSVCFAREDDRDLSKVRVEMPLFDALATGYLETAAGFLNPVEVDSLVLAGKLMTYECGLRFLTDHLAGDTYFRVRREGHNLDRARVQLALLDSIIAHQDRMQASVARAVATVARGA